MKYLQVQVLIILYGPVIRKIKSFSSSYGEEYNVNKSETPKENLKEISSKPKKISKNKL